MAFLRPRTRAELLEAIHQHQDYILVAGATDVWPKIRRGAISTNNFIDLTAVATAGMSIDGQGNIHIPGSTTAAALVEAADGLLKKWPLLVAGARHLGSTLIRNRATIAGNLCTASPCGDLLVALVAYEAQVKLASVGGERTVFIGDFLQGPGRTCRAADEWVEELILPPQVDGIFSKFCKTGRRNALIIAVASMAMTLQLEKGKVAKVNLAFGSVGPTTLRASSTESYLTGKKLSAEVISQAAQMVYEEVKPINDQRASAEYRRQVCRDYLRAALEEASK